MEAVEGADAGAGRGQMEKQIVANVDAAIAELTSLALAGDIAGALEVVDQLIRVGSGSTFVWAQFQAQLLHAAMDDPACRRGSWRR